MDDIHDVSMDNEDSTVPPDVEEETISMDHGDSTVPLDVKEETISIRTRGPTGMHEITRVSSEGHKLVIEYNGDGQPVGLNANKLKSFIGTCARYHVPIIYENWKVVPSETKEKIYDLIQGGFVVDPRSKKNLLQNAGVCFRQFKYWLTTKYIMPFKDDLEKLKSPPIAYCHIEQEHWDTFVNSRLTEEFQELSQKNREMRGKNVYNHRMSRKGYANLIEEMKQSSPQENLIERCVVWKKARMNREGNIVDERTQKVADRIDDILAARNHNGGNTSTSEDVLSLALGTKDAPGQVRGVGKFITHTQYFHKPRRTLKEKVQENETDAQEKTRMAARIKELEEELSKHKTSSQKERSGILSEDAKEKSVELIEKKVKIPTKDDSMKKMKSKKIKDGTSCRLAIGSIDNVVATGTIFESNMDGDNVKVSIDVVVDGDCFVPIPSKEEGNILSQELGSHLLWPRHLIIIDKEKDIQKSKNSKKVLDLSSMTVVQNSPVALHCLLRELEHIGSAIQIKVPIEVFGIQRKCCIMLEDLRNFCQMRPISNACLDAHIMYLYKLIEKSNALSLYKFLDAGTISLSSDTERRAQLLIARFVGMDPNQILIFPYNSGNHWTLIIIDKCKGVAYFMDPLKNRLHEDIIDVVGTAFKVVKKKKPIWRSIKCPKQPGVVECGYYVMRFMREIISQQDISIIDVMKDAPATYTQGEIDVVRIEWAEFVGSHILFA